MKYLVLQNTRLVGVKINLIGVYDNEAAAKAVKNKVRSKLQEKINLVQETEPFIIAIEENKTYAFEYSIGENDIQINGQVPEIKNLISKNENNDYLPF